MPARAAAQVEHAPHRALRRTSRRRARSGRTRPGSPCRGTDRRRRRRSRGRKRPRPGITRAPRATAWHTRSIWDSSSPSPDGRYRPCRAIRSATGYDSPANRPRSLQHRLLVHAQEERPRLDAPLGAGGGRTRRRRARSPRATTRPYIQYTLLAHGCWTCSSRPAISDRRSVYAWPMRRLRATIVVDALDLGQPEGRLQVRQPEVEAELARAGSAGPAESPGCACRARALGQRIVVDQQHAAFAGRDQLVGVEAEAARRAEAAGAAAAVLGAVRLGGVFDDRAGRSARPGPAAGPCRPGGRRCARASSPACGSVMRASTWSTSIVHVCGSESTSTGVAPARTTGSAHEMIVNVGMITSSPGCRSSKATATCSATVPLASAMPCLRPQYAAQRDSNASTCGPAPLIQPDRSASMTDA